MRRCTQKLRPGSSRHAIATRMSGDALLAPVRQHWCAAPRGETPARIVQPLPVKMKFRCAVRVASSGGGVPVPAITH